MRFLFTAFQCAINMRLDRAHSITVLHRSSDITILSIQKTTPALVWPIPQRLSKARSCHPYHAYMSFYGFLLCFLSCRSSAKSRSAFGDVHTDKSAIMRFGMTCVYEGMHRIICIGSDEGGERFLCLLVGIFYFLCAWRCLKKLCMTAYMFGLVV